MSHSNPVGTSECFLGFICNCLGYFITARITFTCNCIIVICPGTTIAASFQQKINIPLTSLMSKPENRTIWTKKTLSI